MKPRELRLERRREHVREEILAATRAVLLDRGLAGLTLAAVAQEVQLTKAALYYYFPSKEALYFELIYQSLDGHSKHVEDAILATTCGGDAIEALIRTSAAHYSERRDELRLSYLVPQVGAAGLALMGPDMLARIRPFNERMYGTVAQKIKGDQRTGSIAKGIDGRRLAFLAHLAVIGMLTVEGLVEVADRAPLIHTTKAMVDDLVRTFRARLASDE
jgi:AcrR family transcriptional regulator